MNYLVCQPPKHRIFLAEANQITIVWMTSTSHFLYMQYKARVTVFSYPIIMIFFRKSSGSQAVNVNVIDQVMFI